MFSVTPKYCTSDGIFFVVFDSLKFNTKATVYEYSSRAKKRYKKKVQEKGTMSVPKTTSTYSTINSKITSPKILKAKKRKESRHTHTHTQKHIL